MEYPSLLLLQDSKDPENKYYSLCGVYEVGRGALITRICAAIGESTSALGQNFARQGIQEEGR